MQLPPRNVSTIDAPNLSLVAGVFLSMVMSAGLWAITIYTSWTLLR